MRDRLRTNPMISLPMSPTQHTCACFALAVVVFLMAFGAYYWNEGVHYHIYLALGLIFALLGLAPLVMQAFQHKSGRRQL
jgi:hypothetical protein